MRRLAPVVIVLVLSVLCFSQTSKETYDSLVAKVKAGDQSIDYFKLREAYFTSDSDFDPTDLRKEMFKQLQSKQFDKALKSAASILEKDYIDIDAHLGAMISERELGHADASKLHDNVIRGLLRSITGGTDGRSAKTAWVVFEVHEEYAVLRLLGLMPKQQSLRKEEGHAFDVMKVSDRNSSNEFDLYFNIDRHMAALGKALGATSDNK